MKISCELVMKKILFVFALLLMPIIMLSCDTNEPEKLTDEFSDDAIRYAVYNGPKFPSDFFREGLADVILNYIMKADLITFTEPATDNYDTALVWVNIRLGELSLDSTNLIDGQSNEKYFEFYWPHPALTGPTYVFRVHKSSYFEGVKFGSQDENFRQILELGAVNYRPINLQFVKDFFDRLWFYKHYNFAGAVVLKRTVSESLINYRYSIYFTHTIGGDFGQFDKIRLFKGEFELNKSDGTSQIKYTLVKEILGNYN
jgi:hypothetical protein